LSYAPMQISFYPQTARSQTRHRTSCFGCGWRRTARAQWRSRRFPTTTPRRFPWLRSSRQRPRGRTSRE